MRTWTIGSALMYVRKNKQRIPALFFLVGFFAAQVVIPPASVYAALQEEAAQNTVPQNFHINKPSADANRPMKQDYAGPMPIVESKNTPAADYEPKPKE